MTPYPHIEGLVVSADFSDCGKYRYQLLLEMREKTAHEKLCVIMQNPSYATAVIADKSVQFIEKLVFKKNYTEFEKVKYISIVNQFAYIQTNDFIGSQKLIGDHNDKHIRDAVLSSDIVLVAWGKANVYAERIEAINKIIQESGKSKLFKTKTHPSRGSYKNFIEKYII
jgi:hypothetical protein